LVLTDSLAPREVLVAGKSGVQKILIDDDMIKSPIYDMVRPEGYITTLMSERDKTAYKKKVCVVCSPRVTAFLLYPIETPSVAWFLH
jgi:hypothetical protein